MVTTPGELPHPFPERRAEPWLDSKWSIGGKERLQCDTNRARFGQRQNVTRADETAVGVRAASANRTAVDHRYFKPCFRQIMRAADPDNSGTDDNDSFTFGRSVHVLWPNARGK